MDLSFARFEQDSHREALSTELAVLLVEIAARQALSPTARAQIGIESRTVPGNDSTFAPAHGAFSSSVAGLLAGTAQAAAWPRSGRPKP